MADKMFSLTHLISETKLLGLIAAHADEVRVDIYQPEKKAGTKRLQNGAAAPLMLEGPKGETATAIALRYMQQHPDRIVEVNEVTQALIAAGKHATAAYTALKQLCEKHLVEKINPGQYKILKAGLSTTTPSAPAEAAPATNNSPPEKGLGRNLVWEELKKGEEVRQTSLFEQFEKHGLKKHSVDGAFLSFIKKGHATRIAPGTYKITKRGLAHAAKS